jgi:hypothetical protein
MSLDVGATPFLKIRARNESIFSHAVVPADYLDYKINGPRYHLSTQVFRIESLTTTNG